MLYKSEPSPCDTYLLYTCNSSIQPCLHLGMTVVKDEDVRFLMSYLSRHSYKWDVIGTALRFFPGDLENIRHSPQVITPQQRLNAVLCQWVQWPTTAHSQVPTMEILRDALRSDLVGLGAVANQLYDIRDQLPSCAATTSGEQGGRWARAEVYTCLHGV